MSSGTTMVNVVGSKKSITATTLGLVLSVSVGTVYYFLSRKLDNIFAFQRSIRVELEELRAEIRQLKAAQNSNPVVKTQTATTKVLKSSLKRNVKFAGGYETADDEEYVTASSSEVSSSEDDPGQLVDLTSLARRVPGSENLLNVNGASKSLNEKQKVAAGDEEFFAKVDALFEGDTNSQNEASECLKDHESKMSQSSEFWWRRAKATHFNATTAGNSGNRELKKEYAFDAFVCAEKALALNPNSANVHKWYAITLGIKGEFISTNEKIQNGYKFKEHIDKAILISPTDSTLHYLLGRFCYEISQLSWIERHVASTLFSTPPSSSYEEALEHFQSAEDLGKPFKDNRLFMAKCYIGMSDYINAGHYLNLASSLPVLTPTDKAAQDEVNSLLQKYKRYIQ